MLFRYGYGDTFWENMVEGCIPLGPGDIPIPEATMMPKLSDWSDVAWND